MNKFVLSILFLLMSWNSNYAQDFYFSEASLHTLTLSDKNDFKLGLFIPTLKQGTKFSIAYSPMKYLIAYGAFVGINKSYFDDDNIRNVLKGHNYSLAGGAYWPFRMSLSDKDIEGDNLLLTYYIGFSKGAMQRAIDRFQSDFDFQKIFTQLGLGYQQSNWRLDLYLKIARLSYLNGSVARVENYPEVIDVLDEIEEKGSFNTLTYNIQFTAGDKAIKAVFGAAYEKNWKEDSFLFSGNSTAYGGLLIDIDDLIKFFKEK